MPLRNSIASIVFMASSLLYILCFMVLFSGVCRVRSSESNELHFISEYISSCLQLPVYNSVFWVLAVTVVASALCVLLNWQEHHACLRYQAGAIHTLVFHFCFNIACVVEFRTNSTALIPGYFNSTISEASLHKFAALQAILDFVCIHSIISSSSCEELEPPHANAGSLELCLYHLVEDVYGVFAYIFLVCWIVQSMLTAAIFEWFLVLGVVAMQWFGIRRDALRCTREMEDNKFHLFAGTLERVGCVSVNLLTALS